MTITENILNFPFRHEEILIPLSVIFMTLYGTSNGFKLPVYMKNLIGNPFFRIFILSLIIYKRRSNPTMALFMSISFTLGMEENGFLVSDNWFLEFETLVLGIWNTQIFDF